MTYFYLFYFILAGLGFELHFRLAKQVLYDLSHTSSPFCSGYFGENYLPWLVSNCNPPDLSLPSS
jgi:hypothetical protein